MTRMDCPHCGQALEADVSVDQAATCPQCGRSVQVDTWDVAAQAAPPVSVAAEAPHESGRSRAAISILAGVVIFLVSMIGVVVVGRHLAQRRAGGPQKTVDQWIDQLQQGETPESRKEAAKAISRRGSAAVLAALEGIAKDRENGAEDSVDQVVRAMAEVGHEMVEPLSRALGSDSHDVRLAAVRVLCETGSDASRATAELAGVLDDDICRVRWYAAEALGRIGPDARSASDALAAATRHEDHHTRLRAVRALAQIGSRAESSLRAINLARDSDPQSEIRRAAETALRQVDSDGLKAMDKEIRALIAKLGDGDGFKRISAAGQLAERGPNAALAIPALTEALEHQDKWLRAAAAEALGSIGREAASAAPALRQLLEDPEAEVRAAGQRALERVQGKPAEQDGSPVA